MTYTNEKTLLWSAAGLLLSFLVLLLVFSGLAGEVLVTGPEEIPETVDAVMRCIQTGAWKDLELLVSGNPALDPATGEADSAENLIWNAYQQSLQWSCEKGFEVQGPHVTQRITVSCLDISAVTGSMTNILAASESTAQSLHTAAEQVLNTDVATIQREITLTLVRENGRWQVIPNSALLALLSGFTAS